MSLISQIVTNDQSMVINTSHGCTLEGIEGKHEILKGLLEIKLDLMLVRDFLIGNRNQCGLKIST